MHAQTRQVIERTFGLLFGRFRRLRYVDMTKTELIPSTIIACCVLHNICLKYNDIDFEEEGQHFLANNTGSTGTTTTLGALEINIDSGSTPEGKELREKLLNFLHPI